MQEAEGRARDKSRSQPGLPWLDFTPGPYINPHPPPESLGLVTWVSGLGTPTVS